jgi:hypothetical protein
MSDEWIKELKEIKEDTDKKIEDVHAKEIELIEKHEEEAKRILNMINELCKPVVKIFIDPSLESDQTKFLMNEASRSASITVPVVNFDTHFPLSLSFRLVLTEDGYMVEILEESYDTVQNKSFGVKGKSMYPPITEEKIKSEIKEFLKKRASMMERLEEKRRIQTRR